MSQDEIITNTKTVVQGLEALKNENYTILNGLLESLKLVKETSSTTPGNDVNTKLMEEKASIITKSIESIELGLNEAHVSSSVVVELIGFSSDISLSSGYDVTVGSAAKY